MGEFLGWFPPGKLIVVNCRDELTDSIRCKTIGPCSLKTSFTMNLMTRVNKIFYKYPDFSLSTFPIHIFLVRQFYCRVAGCDWLTQCHVTTWNRPIGRVLEGAVHRPPRT